MRKQEIINENAIVLDALNNLDEAMENNGVKYLSDLKFNRLRTCSAEVAMFSDYIVLVSYNTLVAFIKDGVLYDVLRYVYGYTSTSAKHIAKFANDYGAKERHTWREVK